MCDCTFEWQKISFNDYCADADQQIGIMPFVSSNNNIMMYVKNVIDNWDPIGLLCHAPNDEYHSEIEEIHYLLSVTEDSTELANCIFKVFTKSFGKEVFNKSKEECKQIAEMLLAHKH